MRKPVLRCLLLMLLVPGTLYAEELPQETGHEPRNLLISLRRRDDARSQTQVNAQSGIYHEGGGRYAAPRSPAQGPQLVTGGRVTIVSTGTRAHEQSVRALEGSTVAIREGKLVALGVGGEWAAIDYAELSEGFEVTARVNDDEVMLALRTHSDRMEDGTVRTGALESSVSGKLGEWIWLGGSSGEGAGRAEGITSTASTRARTDAEYEIRVELAP